MLKMVLGGYCSFYKNLYTGASIKNVSAVKRKLKRGKYTLRVFVITAPFADGDQLDIMHSAFLKQKYYKKHPALVYGIAGSYSEALDIVMRISEDAHTFGMDGDLIGFLKKVSGD